VAPRAAQPNADLLQSARLPCFEWPERTARALGHAYRYGRSRAGIRPPPPAAERPAGLAPLAAGLVPPDAAAAVAAAFGIEVAPSALCDSEEEAVAVATRLGYPVVAKVGGRSFVHKSDVGGVWLGLSDEAAVRAAARDLLRLDPDGRVLIQAQRAGEEVIIGGLRDPQAGPVVMVGLGGVLVEVLADVVFRMAPIDAEEAAAALRSLRGYPVLAGARGRPGVDLDALATTLASASRLLVAVGEISELDLNPVLASSDGATAVDLRILV
jgi:acetyltransferase